GITLELRMKDLSRDQTLKPREQLPSHTVANLKGSGGGKASRCMYITTRSSQTTLNKVITLDEPVEAKRDVDMPNDESKASEVEDTMESTI
ncbi:hypothetical protein HAX54_039065, partial [Datura stramonium]|nr:hypothetical protein [Datura stramonium]